ncbi:MAG: class IIb bacteriocin, lactobin A/cerein 7B family [Bacteroidales bacterium]|jgi:lactobin A/cerein 7B family class IIb bacteriocin|nr:class IIb bacteriocin, lactobin A/cerein 7B family [Bacteroidales bacterium]
MKTNHLNVVELNTDELRLVNGGVIQWWAVVASIALAAEACNIIYEAGKNTGEFIYYVTH